MKPMRALLVAVAIAVLAAGSARAHVEVVDDQGAQVSLPRPAQRIVSLAPHATELLYAAGAGDRVVGVLASSDWPPDATTKPTVGDVHSLDLERIVALKPDLIVTWPYSSAEQVAAFRSRGIPVFITNPTTIDGIATDIERLGTLAGTSAAASARAAEFRTRLARLSQRQSNPKKVRVFYEIWHAPMYTIGGKHLISEAIRACGGENVFASLTLPAPEVSVESVLEARPEAIIVGTDRAVRPIWLDEWKRWTSLPAVSYNNLYTVDANLMHRAGPRFLEGTASLCVVLDRAREALK